ncbi:CFI-box-CTERM domain-containing protein [Candidatus Nitrosotenuis aquarius]|uniref:CFI-box-CTERM domain-containing protein n=1 Tax=Candidatus Nitrosotenuis aquarius TaxID=1846278 RepID=UPI0013C2CA3E|nr:CFI-box-CTERM domain-containing protein [Candidatus Nitrosotenuis aquarius]
MRGAGRLVVALLSVMLFTSTASMAFGQSSQIPPLSVSTELPLYESGDRVVFSGVIKSPDVNNLIDVTVRIVGPIVNGTGATNIVTVKQVRPLLDGTFADNFVVGGPLWNKKGDYKIIVNYGPQKAETMFFYNGGEDLPVVIPPPQCGPGQVIVNNQCVTPPDQKPTTPVCGTGTVLDPATNTCVVAPPPETVECPPGEELVNGKCVETGGPEPQQPVCGPGTHAENGICVPDAKTGEKNGCLIATAAFGTELAPQVQLLREVRDGVLYSTGAGTTFMAGFNEFYYAFSPAVADLERQSPLFKEVVKTAITPMLSTMSILNYANIDSEQEMLGYGVGVILLNIGMYFVAPALVIVKVKGLLQKRRL